MSRPVLRRSVRLIAPRLTPIVIVLSLAAECWPQSLPNTLSESERRGGWRLLFDGKTTSGWRNYRRRSVGRGWVVRDGALQRVAAGAGDLISREQFGEFELTFEYRISKGGNSGVMFHVTERGKVAGETGPEVQILDTANNRETQKAGWLYDLYQPVKPKWAVRAEQQVGYKGIKQDDAARPAGEWNHIYLRVLRSGGEVALNGVSYFYFKKGDADWKARVARSKFADWPHFGKADRGHLSLQDHGDVVAFRSIKIRPLPPDGSVPNPIDRQLGLKPVRAFPQLRWSGWKGVDERGRVQPLRPMILTHAGDGSNRVFVGTQRGVIHVFRNSPTVRSTRVFLDLSRQVHPWKKDNEEGFLGLAFHPDYRKNGQFFVYYTSASEPHTSIVSRFQVDPRDRNRADPASEKVIMKIRQPFANHNGGSIAFARDGMLYIALGDGGGRNDPMGHGQNLATWMGSILRIDVNRQQGKRAYAIPPDNPFVSRQGAKPEIFAYGFRNIWRMSVDRGTGAIFAADVGQDLWEEINVVRRGGNYGWSARESMQSFGKQPARSQDAMRNPLWEYDHRVGKSITGGFVYRGKRLPELRGAYLYADFVSGRVWALRFNSAATRVTANEGIVDSGMPVLSFGEDEHGEVYLLTESAQGQGIHRLDRAAVRREKGRRGK